MPDCIFCRIISGEIPSHKVYEDDQCVAFLDIAPTNVGHVLIVPKEHQPTMIEAPDEMLAQLCTVARRVAQAAVSAVQAPAFNLIVNNGAVAGQLVPHLHIHVIPRFADDGYRPWGHVAVPADRMARIAGDIRSRLA
ncbi:MAG: HIT family protein [Patescibacteria group bacterium]|nr:HIT family protein [Patescibacteria group bacterium]